jgi:hypothetical protein
MLAGESEADEAELLEKARRTEEMKDFFCEAGVLSTLFGECLASGVRLSSRSSSSDLSYSA